MYIRFQGKHPNLGTANKIGIFYLAFELRDEISLPSYAHEEIQRQLSWLAMHLKAPRVLEYSQHYRAISWFKPTAIEPIKRIRAIKAVLEDFGYHVDMVKTRDPGIVIYEDGWQIVAKPRRKPQH